MFGGARRSETRTPVSDAPSPPVPFILTPPEDGCATLKHVKARHTEMAAIPLRCALSVMRFEPTDSGPTAGERADLVDKARKLSRNSKPKGDAG